jgi:hypothetical protein
MSNTTLYDQILESIMEGQSAEEIMLRLRKLPTIDRERVLCTVRSIQNEIARTCLQHGNEVAKLLEELG